MFSFCKSISQNGVVANNKKKTIEGTTSNHFKIYNSNLIFVVNKSRINFKLLVSLFIMYARCKLDLTALRRLQKYLKGLDPSVADINYGPNF